MPGIRRQEQCEGELTCLLSLCYRYQQCAFHLLVIFLVTPKCSRSNPGRTLTHQKLQYPSVLFLNVALASNLDTVENRRAAFRADLGILDES